MSQASAALTAKPASAAALSPTNREERIALLDVLRGFAIFGILFFNMSFFSAPLVLQQAGLEWGSGTADRVMEVLIRFFVQGKFYSLFSFLFGLGFALQMMRAEAREVRFVSLYRRRLLALLLIGLVHAYLIWMGDILTLYALLGFVLFLFRGRQPKTLLLWAGVFFLIPFLLSIGVVAAAGSDDGPGPFGNREDFLILAEKSFQAYGSGSFADIMAQRAQDAAFVTVGGLFGSGGILAMFLLGVYFARRRLFHDAVGSLPFFRRLWFWGLGLGLVGNLVFALAWEYVDPLRPSGWALVGGVGYTLGAPGFCFFYISSIFLLWQSPVWRARLSPLAAVGRTALSNYLFQSVVCTMIFYSYGLGFYGQVGPAYGAGLTVLVFALQVLLSRWWVRRFRFGPAEWFWRTLTYGRLQPMRVEPIAG